HLSFVIVTQNECVSVKHSSVLESVIVIIMFLCVDGFWFPSSSTAGLLTSRTHGEFSLIFPLGNPKVG
ncbi:hypothetical protein ACQP3L_37930, partial [Escherichia coli]